MILTDAGPMIFVSFLKHYYNFSLIFNVVLRLISGTGKVENMKPRMRQGLK